MDVSGFTALIEAHGDRAAAELLESFASMVQVSLIEPGRLVDLVGDAALVQFPGPNAAVKFVSRLFRQAHYKPEFPGLRAGLHHSPVVAREGRFHGATFNLAVRVAAQCRGNQVLGTSAIAEAIHEDNFFDILALESRQLRNIREPVDLFDIKC